MERKIKLQLPQPINFIRLDIPNVAIKPANGFNAAYQEKPSIPIESLSEEEAEQFAEEIKEQFLAHYKYRKLNAKNPLLTTRITNNF